MMNWDTYATLLNEEQKERAKKGLSPLFGENQQELLVKENRQKMITAMKMMKEACRSNDSWNGCENCPFDSFCTMLQRAAIELYHKRDYAQYCPIAWKPDKIEEE